MKTLGQMDLGIAVLKRMGEYLPEKKTIDQTRYNETIQVVDRIMDIFNGRQDSFPMATLIAAHGAADGRPVKACGELIERALMDCGVTIVPDLLAAKLPSLAEHLAHALFRPLALAKAGMTLEEWVVCDDTGEASFFIASVMAPVGIAIPRRESHLKKAAFPADAAAFGRCYRLLQVVPEWRFQLSHVAEVGGPVWAVLVDNWSELSTLHEAQHWPGLHRRITALIEQAQAKA